MPMQDMTKETDINVLFFKTGLFERLVELYGKDAINGLLNNTHKIIVKP